MIGHQAQNDDQHKQHRYGDIPGNLYRRVVLPLRIGQQHKQMDEVETVAYLASLHQQTVRQEARQKSLLQGKADDDPRHRHQ